MSNRLVHGLCEHWNRRKARNSTEKEGTDENEQPSLTSVKPPEIGPQSDEEDIAAMRIFLYLRLSKN